MDARYLRYVPLCQYLEQLPAEQQTVQLRLAEMETLIDGALPPSALWSTYWSGGGVARRNWRRSGWQAKLARPAAVLFTRLTEVP